MKENIETIKTEQNSELAIKKIYQTPHLTNYGKVQATTKANSGNTGDDSSDGLAGDTFYVS